MEGAVGEADRGARGSGEQAEQQQGSDRLGRLGGADPGQGEEAVPEKPDRYPAGGGHSLVECGEQQRSGDEDHQQADPGGHQGGDDCAADGDAEDGAGQHTDAGGAVHGAARGRVEGDEEGAEAEDPRRRRSR